MPGSGAAQPDVLFVGEGPGANEDAQGEPFVGRSGQLLRDAIEVLGLKPDEYRFTNTVRCRPPDNRTPKPSEIKHCAPYLLEEIERTKPQVIVLLGNSPLRAVLGESGITNWNGVVIERDGVTYVPAYHPAFLLRNNSYLEPWIKALEKAKDAARGKSFQAGDSHYEYILPEYVPELEAMKEEVLAFDGPVSYDAEFINLDPVDPNNVILTLGFAIDRKAWSFPLDHRESWWEPSERAEVVRIVEEVLLGAKIVTHTKIDYKLTKALLGIDFRQYGDTIHLSRLLRAHREEHGLKLLAGLYLQMYDYDRALDEYKAAHPEADYAKGGNYGNIPLDILLPYGGKDVSATWMLHDKMMGELTPKQRALYLKMIIPADRALARMELNGFKLDYKLMSRYEAIYELLMGRYYDRLMLDPDVQAYIAERQREMDEDWTERQSKSKRALKRYTFEFNPNSSQQVQHVLYRMKGYPVPAYTKTGNPSVNKDQLKEIVFDFQAQGRSVQFLEDYMNYKLLSSVLSKTFQAMKTVGSDWYSLDGRSRSDYHLGGAKTGRIASRNPNLQNIPSVESEPGTILQYMPVKNAFTHTYEGGGLLMIDYSGMELRVMASIAGISGMVDVFNRKGDVHRYVSSLIYRKPEPEITKFERYRGKWCNWSLLYMGGWWTLYRLYRINGLTEDEAKRIAELYYTSFPELQQYHRRIISFAKKNGYVESAFGRRLELPEIKFGDEGDPGVRSAFRTAVNMPIQGVASDTLMAAVAIIDYFMEQRQYKSMMVNTVHDSLVIDYHPDELEAVSHLCVDVMENIPDYAKEFMPGISFKWLKVPLKADLDIGNHYGTYGQARQLECPDCHAKDMAWAGEFRNHLYYSCPHCAGELDVEWDGEAATKRLYNRTHPESISYSARMLRGKLGVITRNPRTVWPT